MNLNIASHTYTINIHTLTVLLSYLPDALFKASLSSDFFNLTCTTSPLHIYTVCIAMHADKRLHHTVQRNVHRYLSIIQPVLCLLISANPPTVTCLIRALVPSECSVSFIGFNLARTNLCFREGLFLYVITGGSGKIWLSVPLCLINAF